ncbi:hypothetical protein ACHAW5_006153 [Stephanodiscus triporus]|uniref:CXXC-type domain-containing protein n=1 Tax=Stephanodiscus triporus TaxID=2934178 RepID=A0ABD3N5S7_9STRA
MSSNPTKDDGLGRRSSSRGVAVAPEGGAAVSSASPSKKRPRTSSSLVNRVPQAAAKDANDDNIVKTHRTIEDMICGDCVLCRMPRCERCFVCKATNGRAEEERGYCIRKVRKKRVQRGRIGLLIREISYAESLRAACSSAWQETAADVGFDVGHVSWLALPKIHSLCSFPHTLAHIFAGGSGRGWKTKNMENKNKNSSAALYR